MYVRLTCKLADMMEGVDLSAYAEGDVIDLSEPEAALLIKGGWAERVDEKRVSNKAPLAPHAIAAENAS